MSVLLPQPFIITLPTPRFQMEVWVFAGSGTAMVSPTKWTITLTYVHALLSVHVEFTTINPT